MTLGAMQGDEDLVVQPRKSLEQSRGMVAAEVKEELVATHRPHEGRGDHGAQVQIAAVGEVSGEYQQRLALDQRAEEDQQVTVLVK